MKNYFKTFLKTTLITGGICGLIGFLFTLLTRTGKFEGEAWLAVCISPVVYGFVGIFPGALIGLLQVAISFAWGTEKNQTGDTR